MNYNKYIDNTLLKADATSEQIKALCEESKKYDTDVYCIGGERVYRQLLPYCDEAFITKIDHAYEADSFFPNLDEMPEWEMTETSDEQTYFDLEYTFTKYERKH